MLRAYSAFSEDGLSVKSQKLKHIKSWSELSKVFKPKPTQKLLGCGRIKRYHQTSIQNGSRMKEQVVKHAPLRK